ncbi:reverse transcriptase [Caerostris extrusa]|uniref:Reverse transcriptase n=1 Tax=Caerostris extrusa TaxID=172846 RepID=A0AAV4YC35_CAEEX|nr:reverse transcriptase [Caerostris extrusa]
MLGSYRNETFRNSKCAWPEVDTETDELYCVSPEIDMGISDNISKRKLLSIVNSIYDPIGFTSPATLLPKLLLQEAWRNKLDWDEELTLDMQLRYRRWAKHIALIEKWRIPRRILYGNFKKLLYTYLLMLQLMGMPAVLFYDVKMKERVKEIRELTKVEDWRFVPEDVNPADLPSRSCNWFELLRSKWWEGPKYLYEPPEFCPYTEITLPEEAMKERRKSVVVNLNIDTKEHFGNRLLYFSSYPRIIRMIAWILRFCQNIRVNSHKLTKELSYEEIQSAEEALIRIIQSEWPTDIQEKYAQTIVLRRK